MSTRDTHLLSGAYVLHAVSDEEAAAVEAAVAESEELRGEVVGLADTAVALGLALPAITPPPSLRASVLASIEGAAQERPLPAGSSASVSTTAHVVPRRRRRRVPRPAVLLAAGALAVALFGGGVLVQRALIEPQLEYSQVLAAPDAQRVNEAVNGGGTIMVTTSRSKASTAVALHGVTVPAGDALQLWVLHGGSAVSAGLYDTGSEGQVLHRLPGAGERIAVTVEPAGGSKQPTTVPIAVVEPA